MSADHRLPIIFVYGLSGAGKSSLGEELQKRLNYLHIEQDIPNGGNGIDDWGFRDEWNKRFVLGGVYKLVKRIQSFRSQNSMAGVVVTFDSLATPSIDEINHEESAGITSVILYGTDKECLASYLVREATNGTNRDRNRWFKYNLNSSEKFRKPEYEPYRLSVFENGKHRPMNYLIEQIRLRVR